MLCIANIVVIVSKASGVQFFPCSVCIIECEFYSARSLFYSRVTPASIRLSILNWPTYYLPIKMNSHRGRDTKPICFRHWECLSRYCLNYSMQMNPTTKLTGLSLRSVISHSTMCHGECWHYSTNGFTNSCMKDLPVCFASSSICHKNHVREYYIDQI